MSTSAARHPSVRTPSGWFAYASFAIMVGGWVAFAVALAASQQTLDDVWTSVRDLPNRPRRPLVRAADCGSSGMG